jgi:hypothetical protein
MEVISGIGDFLMKVEHVEVRDGRLVLVGRMAAYEPGAQSARLRWEAEMFSDGPEFARLLAAAIRPRVLWWVICSIAEAATSMFRRSPSQDNPPS